MQDLIKRYFWILGAIVVTTCAVFAAKAASNIVSATVLNDSDKTKLPVPTAPQPSAAAPAARTHTKDGTQLAGRNMFCSDCTPPVESTAKSNDGSIQTTSLPLSLLATNVGTDPKQSYATIVNTDTSHQGAYMVGDRVPGATGNLTAIHYKFVEFENSGHTERLGLLGAVLPPPQVAVETPKDDENKDDLQVAVDNGVKKIDDNNYEIDKSLVDKILANPMVVAKAARVVPSMKNGKPDGFKLYAIRPTSVYAKIGLQNGDTLNSINGFSLDSADKALEVYTKLREANQLEAEITRRGKTMTIKYAIK